MSLASIQVVIILGCKLNAAPYAFTASQARGKLSSSYEIEVPKDDSKAMSLPHRCGQRSA